MPITFYDKQEAEEYAERMKKEGLRGVVVIQENDKYLVYLKGTPLKGKPEPTHYETLEDVEEISKEDFEEAVETGYLPSKPLKRRRKTREELEEERRIREQREQEILTYNKRINDEIERRRGEPTDKLNARFVNVPDAALEQLTDIIMDNGGKIVEINRGEARREHDKEAGFDFVGKRVRAENYSEVIFRVENEKDKKAISDEAHELFFGEHEEPTVAIGEYFVDLRTDVGKTFKTPD